jgi:hypothetical protein
MSRLQSVSTRPREVRVPPSRHNFSRASVANHSVQAPRSAESLLPPIGSHAIDTSLILNRVAATKRKTTAEIDALDLLKRLAMNAASGDKNAIEALAALPLIAKLVQPAADPISPPDVKLQVASASAVDASGPAAPAATSADSEPDKQPLTPADKLVRFGDRVDKGLKPLTLLLPMISAIAGMTTIATNLGATL